jgi:glucose-6-phosphate 1-dehydrogenase
MSSKLTTPTILVIVGISGDLAHRKLLPAIREIAVSDVMPDHFKIVGISRREIGLDDVLPKEGDQAYLRQVLELRQMDLDNEDDYAALADRLNEIEGEYGAPAQRLFYLSVPPMASQPVIEKLGTSGIAKAPDTKLLLEKPFGTDLASAEQLIDHIRTHFSEDQVYRIDHYLAKEMTQNLVVFRSGNSLFKRTWNKDFIESIDISASQEIGIEGRAAFYEQTGALRDIVQSHLMQLAALTLMELPVGDDWQAIPAQRLQALKDLHILGDLEDSVIRGQYKGYREEVSNPNSVVETFVSLNLGSSDPRWEGVPITLSTGKSLDRTSTEIKICYRRDEASESNTLVLRIQPNEGVEVRLWAKQPGYERKLRQLPLNFSYSDHFVGLPEAYERVFVDAMRGDRSLFTSSDEVLASWETLKPVQDAWSKGDGRDLIIYEPGTACSDITDTIGG